MNGYELLTFLTCSFLAFDESKKHDFEMLC